MTQADPALADRPCFPHHGGLSDYEVIATLAQGRREALFELLGEDGLLWLERSWPCRARPGQLPPPGDWPVWLIMAGRGFGKTRAGAEWVRAIAERDGQAAIALVGASQHDARAVMVEGPSGLLAIAPPGNRPDWSPSRRELRWPNGARATTFGAAEPEGLRGPQHSHGWADELGKWPNGTMAWDNLAMGMRLGTRPRIVATTTPRPVPLLMRLQADPAVIVTGGRTSDNRAELPEAFLADMARNFGGTRLGRQELGGELLLDFEGALWTRALIERCRHVGPPPKRADFARLVIGVDPPASSHGDECGIVVVAVDAMGLAYVLADLSIGGASPERWARQIADAATLWQADRIVAEANNGGEMVGSVLRATGIPLSVKLVHAAQGKTARAEPVAALYEAGRVRHVSAFPALEDQLCAMLINGRYEGPSRSPDRADALIWSLFETNLSRHGAARLRRL
jgi:phage terminase large subunit-like protein